jgi:hypothetical protein
LQEVFVAKRFRQELDRTGFYRLNAHRNVAVAGDENNWSVVAEPRELRLKLKAADTRQTDVKPIRRPARERASGMRERCCAFTRNA